MEFDTSMSYAPPYMYFHRYQSPRTSYEVGGQPLDWLKLFLDELMMMVTLVRVVPLGPFSVPQGYVLGLLCVHLVNGLT